MPRYWPSPSASTTSMSPLLIAGTSPFCGPAEDGSLLCTPPNSDLLETTALTHAANYLTLCTSGQRRQDQADEASSSEPAPLVTRHRLGTTVTFVAPRHCRSTVVPQPVGDKPAGRGRTCLVTATPRGQKWPPCRRRPAQYDYHCRASWSPGGVPAPEPAAAAVTLASAEPLPLPWRRSTVCSTDAPHEENGSRDVAKWHRWRRHK